MKEEEPNWYSRRKEDLLPSPDELMPLSQTLITPDLAVAFDIPPNPTSFFRPPATAAAAAPAALPPAAMEYDSSDLAGGSDEQARTLKRPRLVWTPQLHKRFVDAVAHLGIKNAVPKTIMQLMSVDGLTRENVASHLQKYRLYLKRMQGLSSGGAGAGAGAGAVSAADSAMDHLFASAPVPHHFLGGPFVPPTTAIQHHHHHHQQQQMAAAAAFYGHRNMAHLGSSGFDLGFQARQQQQPPTVQRMAGTAGMRIPTAGTYHEEFDSGGGEGGGGRKVLTLFPTSGD